MFNSTALNFNKIKTLVDWKLLGFLILFLNIKLEVKIAALVLIYILQFDFGFGFRLKDSRLPLFYLLILPISIAGFIINKNYQNVSYLLVFSIGVLFWLLCIGAVHQINLMVERNDIETIHRTITAFFILNAVFSIANLAVIIWHTHSFNPYTFKGFHQQYFVSTGDYIKGITFDISSTNGALNVLGVVYFLIKNKPEMACLCMAILMLTASNLITLMLLFTLGLLFVFRSTKDQKSIMIMCLAIFLTFMLKISPQNTRYVTETFKRALHMPVDTSFRIIVAPVPITSKPDSILNPEEKREKIATLYLDNAAAVIKKQKADHDTALAKTVPVTGSGKVYIPPPYIYDLQFRIGWAIVPDQKILLDFIAAHKSELPLSSPPKYTQGLPGKLTGIIQTLKYLHNQPTKILAGTGIGNFSSKIAFRATGLGLRGKYPAQYTYINPAFLSNHLDLYMNFFSRDVGLHSVTNNPFSVYDQLLSEYGLLGLAALLIYYLGFFAKQYQNLTYGIPLLLIISAFFFIDYWFEQLSLMVLFELMLFLNIKETKALTNGK